MFTMLLEETKTDFWSRWGLLIILVVLLVGMFIWNFYRQKKYQKQEELMMQEIKVGSKVKTYSGIYGTVVGIYDTTDGRVAILSLDGKTTMEIDFRAIYGVDQKEEVKEEPVVETAEETAEETTQAPAEEVKEEVEVKPEAEKVEEPVKKAKKTSKKSK